MDDPWARECGATEPLEPVRGFTGSRYFFRQPTGPGWALLGDAGIHRDFSTGDGMSEALVQARALAQAVRAGTLREFQRARDREALPRFFFAKDQGRAAPRSPLEAALHRHLRTRPALTARIAESLEYRRAPQSALSPGRVLGVACLAALTGTPAALVDFVRAAGDANALEDALRAV